MKIFSIKLSRNVFLIAIILSMVLKFNNSCAQKVNLVQELRKNFNGQILEVEISNIELLNLDGLKYNSDADNKGWSKKHPVKANSYNEATNSVINSPYSRYYGKLSFNLEEYTLKLLERDTKKVIHIQSGRVVKANISVNADSKYTISYSLNNKIEFSIMLKYFDKGDSSSPVVIEVISGDPKENSVVKFYGSSTIEGVVLL